MTGRSADQATTASTNGTTSGGFGGEAGLSAAGGMPAGGLPPGAAGGN